MRAAAMAAVPSLAAGDPIAGFRGSGRRRPGTGKALGPPLIEPERQDLQQMLRRAIARGEVAPGNPALDYVMHMMLGAFIARDAIDDRPADQAFVRSYIDAVVLPALGLTPQPADRG